MTIYLFSRIFYIEAKTNLSQFFIEEKNIFTVSLINQGGFHTSDKQEHYGGGRCAYLWRFLGVDWAMVHYGYHSRFPDM